MRIVYLSKHRRRKTIVRLPDYPFGWEEMRAAEFHDGVEFADSQAFRFMLSRAVLPYGRRIRRAPSFLRELAEKLEKRVPGWNEL